jgi:hypothetical protein
MQPTKGQAVKKMTRYTAYQKADRLWGSAASQGMNRAHVCIRQKKVTNRFEAGYYAHASGKLTVMGAGPSWEAAFEQAARNEQAASTADCPDGCCMGGSI